MDVRSLGYRTDLALLQVGGSEIEDRGHYLVARTPGNPHFHWGNFLLLAAPPEPGSADHWVATARAEFPASRHVALGVDGSDGTLADLAPLKEAGFTTETSVVMTATSVHLPPRPNTEAEMRPLTSDDDWNQQVALSMAGEPEHYSLPFAAARELANRAHTEAGRGLWWGAFVDGRLVSSLGIVRAGEGLARFQTVKTHEDFRGRGLAGSLVELAGRSGFEELGAETLVMVADPDYLAIRVYRSVGFTDGEVQLQATLLPQ
ncbi:MAG TPA: GNAT family N-acetyltransferase [Nocardioides sp.]|nr:GNAT family N-acetyltransferase [Nocardioides sp.]